jgi:hypothetical protein
MVEVFADEATQYPDPVVRYVNSSPGRLINFRRASLAQRIGPSFPRVTVATPEMVRTGATSSHPCSRIGDKSGYGPHKLAARTWRLFAWTILQPARLLAPSWNENPRQDIKCSPERPADDGRKLAGRVKSSTSGRSARGTIATK